jgi:mono/diheme cytochrome c family protein
MVGSIADGGKHRTPHYARAVRTTLVRLAGAGLLAVVLVAGACGGEDSAAPADPVLAEGQTIYRARCASCHGANGGGGLAPRLAGRMTERFPDAADQVALITNGVDGTAMRAFGGILDQQQINAVVRYTREAL